MLRHVIDALKADGVPFHNQYRLTQGAWNPMRGGADRLAKFLRVGVEQMVWGDVWPWFEMLSVKKAGIPLHCKGNVKEYSKDEQLKDVPVTAVEFEEIAGIPFPSADPQWLKERLLAKKQKLFDYSFQIVEKRGTQALIETPNVTIGTIHSVKGGEADSVYLFPDLSRAALRERWFDVEGDDSMKRLFYVGMTRTKNKLVLGRGMSRNSISFPKPEECNGK